MLAKLQNMIANVTATLNFTHIIPLSLWLSAILATAIISGVAIFVYNHVSQKKIEHWPLIWLQFVVDILKKPLFFFIVSYGVFIGLAMFFPKPIEIYTAAYILNIVEFITFFWLLFNVLVIGKKRLLHWSFVVDNKVLNVIIPAIITGLQIAVFLLMLNLFIPVLNFDGIYGIYLNKLSKVLFIGALGTLFIQIVNALEKLIVHQYVLNDNASNFTGRKIQTQVLLLKRMVIAIAMIITLASIFLVFDSVKNIGAGLLTSAGIIGAVVTFASQQSISRLFSGLQLAFTQPIRLGDTVIIDNLLGTVEEITLSYIVIKLWDLRRLLLPTDHVTSKGLQNLTRDTTQLLGTIFFYTDYTLPVDVVRQKFHELLQESKFWDGKVWALQVTDIKESTMEIRALASAENSSTLWNLRCEIREKLIGYIVKNHPHCLSKSRTINANFAVKDEGGIGSLDLPSPASL